MSDRETQMHGIAAMLADAGTERDVIEAVLRLDALMQTWRRRFTKRELGTQALRDLGLDIDLAQLDVLAAVEAPVHEFGETQGEETMISTVAARLGIDPSRASRLTADLVDRGYLRRAVSQADSRRTIIELTPRGEQVIEAVRRYKFLLMGDYFGEWDASELQSFLPMLERFSAWTDDLESRRQKFSGPIAALAKSVRQPETVE